MSSLTTSFSTTSLSSTLPGSYKAHLESSAPAGPLEASQQVEITLVLRRKRAAANPSFLQKPLTHAELGERCGASAADIQAVEAFALRNHLAVANLNPAARTIALKGPLSRLAELFGASLEMRRSNGKAYRSRRGYLQVPNRLEGIVTGVFGFDTRPAARAKRKFTERANPAGTFTPTQLRSIYNFPGTSGQGQTIALIELGGGFRASDLSRYWQSLSLQNVKVAPVSVSGAANTPEGSPDGPDGEVVLDIEVAGGVAPGASIAVYFAPNTDQGFLGAINAAIHDTVRKPSVISISWGSAESDWTEQSLNAFNQAFHDAALLGITVIAAAGDNGSSDGAEDGLANVDFPASSPFVLACGGTRLVASASTIKSETVWNDGEDGGATGGGVSSYFPLPAYQANAGVPVPAGGSSLKGRGVPDVAALADPETGYMTLVDGNWGVVGGTSAVAPLWAGLISLLNEKLGKPVGYLHPALYGTVEQHKALHDVVSGTNGAYKAGPGWDACTGLGTPDGQAILSALQSIPKNPSK
jgi:kumamolisin